MRTPIQTGRVRVNGIVDAAECTGGAGASETALGRVRDRRGWRAVLALLLLWVLAALPAQANISPPGCGGSGLGISLFTSLPNVHVGDTVFYNVLVFNTPFPACDASEIEASVVTPDGVTHVLTLRRTTLAPGESDYYTNAVPYVVRSQDIRTDGTLRATAEDSGNIHQNEVNSRGGGFQGVNTLVNIPGISIAADCTGSVGQNGVITFTGTVVNTGNTTLDVTITNLVNGGSVLVTRIDNLAKGTSAPFSGSWVPANPCEIGTASITAYGVDSTTATPKTVTATTTTSCGNVLTPGVDLTLNCPTAPVSAGQMLVYTGQIKNTGNVTLKDLVVLADQPAPNTPVFTIESLAPGATANYSGSFAAPADACTVTTTASLQGASICGTAVSDSATVTCNLATAPQINVTVACPENPVGPGATLTYSGTVKNTGNVTLNEVTVVSDRPVQGTVIFNGGTMAPGATANFTGSYTVPADGCSVSVTVAASGKDNCTAVAVNHAATATCLSTTAPGLAVTLACPPATVTAGESITYSGTVRNTGNIALNNVVVLNGQSEAIRTVFGPVSLAVGASADFGFTSTAPADACSVTTSVTARGDDACKATPITSVPAETTCPLTSAPAIDLTLACPTAPVGQGGTLTFSGTIKNTGNMTLTNVVVRNDRVGATPVFSAPTLAPAAVVNFTGSYQVGADVCSVTSTATVEAMSVCGTLVQKSVTSTCTLQTQPQINVTVACPEARVAPGSTLTYGGTVKNTGDVTLNDVVVVSDRPGQDTVIFNGGTMAPGATANFTGSYTVPADGCSVAVTVRASGKDNCTSVAVTHSATATCLSTTTPGLAVTIDCPPNTVAAGQPITYTGTVRNTGDIALNNVVVLSAGEEATRTLFGPVNLAVGAFTNYTATFATSADTCSTTHTVMAQAQDACSSQVVKSDPQAATCTLLTAPAIQVSHECPVTPLVPGGEVVYQGSVRNSGDVTLANVVVTGNLGTAASTVTTLYGDDAMPAGSSEFLWGGDTWNWVTNNPTPFSGSRAHQSAVAAGVHQHVFENARETLSVGAGDVLFTHVYLDPENLPTQVMVEWQVGTGSFAHRAYWGANQINLGQDGTDSRRYMGPLPAAGQWVRLEVPASRVGLEGLAVNGMAFTLYGGRGTWDASGKVSSTSAGSGEISTVFTVASLAPGESRSFAATNTVPTGGACAFTSTLTAVGGDKCTGTQVTATSTKTCPIVTAPAIEVTHECPDTLVPAGGMLTYRGVVRNTGNITLNNVTVKANRPADDTVAFTVATLAPGASAEFTGTYQVPINCCVVWSTLTATGDDACNENSAIATDTTACTVLTTPKLVVTKVCPAEPVKPGALLEFSGTLNNAGDIALIDVVVRNNQAGNQPVFGPITLAPGETVDYVASYTVPMDFCGTDTVTATGLDACTLEAVTDSVTTTCPIETTPRIAVLQSQPTAAVPKGGIYTVTGTVRNQGDVTLKDVYAVVAYQADCYTRSNVTVLGPIILAPGASQVFSRELAAPLSCCEIVTTVSAHGIDGCVQSETLVKASSSVIRPLASTPRLFVTRSNSGGGAYTGMVKNNGDVALTNVFVYTDSPAANTVLLGPIELAPNESKPFAGQHTMTDDSQTTADHVRAAGADICNGTTVAAHADDEANGMPSLVINSISTGAESVSIVWQATPGATYRVQAAADLANPVWSDLPGDVTASGPVASKQDTLGANGYRVYRVKIVE